MYLGYLESGWEFPGTVNWNKWRAHEIDVLWNKDGTLLGWRVGTGGTYFKCWDGSISTDPNCQKMPVTNPQAPVMINPNTAPPANTQVISASTGQPESPQVTAQILSQSPQPSALITTKSGGTSYAGSAPTAVSATKVEQKSPSIIPLLLAAAALLSA